MMINLVTSIIIPTTIISCNLQPLPIANQIKADLEANYRPQLKPEFATLSWDQYQELTKWVFDDPPVSGSYRNLIQALEISPQAFFANTYPPNSLKLTIAKRDLIAYSDHIEIKISIWAAGDQNGLEAKTDPFKIKVNVILT